MVYVYQAKGSYCVIGVLSRKKVVLYNGGLSMVVYKKKKMALLCNGGLSGKRAFCVMVVCQARRLYCEMIV